MPLLRDLHWIGAVVITPSVAIATAFPVLAQVRGQDVPLCYYRTSSGQMVDLSAFCGRSPTPTTPAVVPTSTPASSAPGTVPNSAPGSGRVIPGATGATAPVRTPTAPRSSVEPYEKRDD
jgi:hypothetical protein